MDRLITSKLRESALLLRQASTKDLFTLRKMKASFLEDIYNTLSIALGSSYLDRHAEGLLRLIREKEGHGPEGQL